MAYLPYIYGINVYIMAAVKKFLISKPLDPHRSGRVHVIASTQGNIEWKTSEERINIIRQGVPYGAIENVSVNLGVATGKMLDHLSIAQRTYNKKKKEDAVLDPRFSESILELQEIYDFGVDVFNNEKEKFLRWLKKPNQSLGNVTPESLFDSLTGINEVRKALTRMEYGNMA